MSELLGGGLDADDDTPHVVKGRIEAKLRQHKREREKEKDILKLKKRMNKFLEAKSCHRERQTV